MTPCRYETTANTLAFTIYLLAVNPEVEKRLVAEVDAFGRANAITTADLDKVRARQHSACWQLMTASHALCLKPFVMFQTVCSKVASGAGNVVPGALRNLPGVSRM